uniref:L-type lectin-domain containing protein n=1 Tax=Aureivirga sp. CE67 TaxID=1788983 RepID=UPI0018CA3F1B
MNNLFKYFTSIVFIYVLLCSSVSHAQLTYNLIGDATDEGDDCFIITPDLNGQSGAVWYENEIDFNQDFTILYNSNFGVNDSWGADGMALIFKTTSTPEIGNLGGGIGYQGIDDSIVVEFDTWHNGGAGDPSYDHISILKNGSNNHNLDGNDAANTEGNLAGPVQASFYDENIEDGEDHLIKIDWDASSQKLSVYFDCKLRTFYSGDVINDIFGGNNIGYFGFTGSTGGASNLHQICFQYLSFVELADIEDKVICEGETVDDVDVTFTGAFSYEWSPAAGVSDITIPDPVFSPTVTTTYEVEIYDDCGDKYENTFTIEVTSPPVFTEPVDQTICQGDLFDLNTVSTTILADMSTLISYYNDAAFTDEITDLTNFSPNTTQTVYIKLGGGECGDSTQFEMTVIESPALTTPDPISFCSFTGTEIYDLDSLVSTITSDTTVDVKFYSDATFTTEIIDLTNYTVSSTHSVYVLATNTTGCTSSTSVEFIMNLIPVVTTPADIVQCADNTTFDLTTQDDAITTETGVAIVYYDGAGVEITNADSYTGTNGEIITATVTNTTSNCEDSVTFELILNPLPVVTPTYTIYDCDLDEDGLITWDLTLQNSNLDNSGTYTVTYYSDAGLASEITNSDTFISGDTTVYYQLEDNVTGCLNSGMFNVEIGDQPTVDQTFQYELCDDLVADGIRSFDLTTLDAQILGSNTNTSISYYEVLDFAPGADLPTSPAIANPADYVSDSKTIYAYLYNNDSLCWVTTEIELVVGEIPVISTDIDHLEVCDDDYDGFSLFNLSIKETEILTPTVDPDTATVEYYNTQDDAEAGTNQIVAPNIVNYQNATQNVHQVWVKVYYALGECAAYTSFYVIVHPKPLINEVNNIEMCDDGDGSVAFDLTNTQTTEEILNGQNGISITYFTDLNEANQAVIDEANGNVGSFAYIATPDNFENTVTPVQTIYAVLKNDVTGCGTVTPFNIEVLPQPEFPDELQTLEVCEDDINDGITTVYLTDADAYYNASTPGFIVTYHHTEADAFDGLNAIASPYINNATPDNFTVWVRLENNVTHCFDITTLEVIIHESPASTIPTPLEVCDDNNDGFAEFNLTLKDTEITYALGQVTVTYFEELIDAQEEIYDNAISNSTAYPNVDINNQVVYALVKNTITGCTDIVALELIVNPTPTAIVPEAIELCDDEVVDGMTTFDLTVREGEIVAETGISFEYYYTEAAAISGDVTNTAQGVGYILNPTAFVNETNPQTVWVRAEYAATDCAKVVPLELIVNAIPVLVQPTPLEFCDEDVDGDDTNGVVQGFLLYEKDAEILNGGTGEVVYHEGAIDGPVINKLVPY